MYNDVMHNDVMYNEEVQQGQKVINDINQSILMSLAKAASPCGLMRHR